MQINAYTPISVAPQVASVNALTAKTPVSPATLKPNPAGIISDVVEIPQPIDYSPGNPAAIVNNELEFPQPFNYNPASLTDNVSKDELVSPPPVTKSPLLTVAPVLSSSITPGNEVNTLPWSGPNVSPVSPATPDRVANKFDPAALRELPSVKAELGKLKKATTDVESVMLKDLVSKMRASNGKSLFGSGFEHDMHEDMLNDAISSRLASAGGIGLAATIYKGMEGIVLRRAAAAEFAKANPASAN